MKQIPIRKQSQHIDADADVLPVDTTTTNDNNNHFEQALSHKLLETINTYPLLIVEVQSGTYRVQPIIQNVAKQLGFSYMAVNLSDGGTSSLISERRRALFAKLNNIKSQNQAIVNIGLSLHNASPILIEQVSDFLAENENELQNKNISIICLTYQGNALPSRIKNMGLTIKVE